MAKHSAYQPISIQTVKWFEGDYQAYLATMSKVRQEVVNSILPQVVESLFGDTDGRFKRLAPTWSAASIGTSCGTLPHFVAEQLKVKGFGWGTGGLRDDAMKVDAWIEGDSLLNTLSRMYGDGEKRRPLPGDLYGLAKLGDSKKGIVHVGVIVDPRPRPDNVWVTADAGQGEDTAHQQARYCKRKYNPQDFSLSDPTNLDYTTKNPPRVIAGWVDIDKLKRP
jgi:hypothetical protein